VETALETPLEISFMYLGKNEIYLISEAAALSVSLSVSHFAQNAVYFRIGSFSASITYKYYSKILVTNITHKY
jgi:hypothetical protein